MKQVLIDADELAELRDDAQCARELVEALGSRKIDADDPDAALRVLEAVAAALIATMARETVRKARQQS